LDRRETVVDLKKGEGFIEEYVSLRNRYSGLLATKPVNVAETREWLRDNQVEVRVLVKDDIILGAVILYLNRDGEIAFFVKKPHQGTGIKLLKIIERVAKERNLKGVWAWVLNDNIPAQRIFEKNGFLKEGMAKKMHDGVMKEGIRYKKKLQVESEQ